MAGERMVPLLPCASVEATRDFFAPLGFETTFQQHRPNPYLALRREDLHLHYFGLPGLRPEDSYGSCLVLVQDTQPLFDLFAAGLRAQFGRLPLTGFPRITRPRRRQNAGNLSGFSLVDPSGNWIRIVRVVPEGDSREQLGEESDLTGSRPTSKVARAHANAVVLADSKGDVEQAAKVLGGALARQPEGGAGVDGVQALAYLAELSVRLDDAERARELISQIDALHVSDVEPRLLATVLADVKELRATLDGPASTPRP